MLLKTSCHRAINIITSSWTYCQVFYWVFKLRQPLFLQIQVEIQLFRCFQFGRTFSWQRTIIVNHVSWFLIFRLRSQGMDSTTRIESRSQILLFWFDYADYAKRSVMIIAELYQTWRREMRVSAEKNKQKSATWVKANFFGNFKIGIKNERKEIPTQSKTF